jgi:hypothetical protein
MKQYGLKATPLVSVITLKIREEGDESAVQETEDNE